MKKIFKIIPILLLTSLAGCTPTSTKPSEVSEDAWNKAFHMQASEFFKQNIIIEGNSSKAKGKYEIDNYKMCESIEGFDNSYSVITPEKDNLCTLEYIYKKNDAWNKRTSKTDFESIFYDEFLYSLAGFEFYEQKDFKVENSVYKLDKLDVDIYSWDGYTQKDIQITFANNKLSTLSFNYDEFSGDKGQQNVKVDLKFSYGKAKVVIPEVKNNPYVTIDVEEGINLTIAPYEPLQLQDNTLIRPEECRLGDASFDHNTLFGTDLASKLVNKQGYYFGFAFNITLGESAKLDFEKSFVVTNPKIEEGKVSIARALRIAFAMEDSAFVYAPLQVEEKCSYSKVVDDSTKETKYQEGELFDMNSTAKVVLPANKTITVVTWIDGWDENCVNVAIDQQIAITLGFTK